MLGGASGDMDRPSDLEAHLRPKLTKRARARATAVETHTSGADFEPICNIWAPLFAQMQNSGNELLKYLRNAGRLIRYIQKEFFMISAQKQPLNTM